MGTGVSSCDSTFGGAIGARTTKQLSDNLARFAPGWRKGLR